MSGQLGLGADISGAYEPEDIDELLDAAAEVERALEIEAGLLLRNLAQMLRKQAKLQGLRKEFDRR